MHSFFEFVDVKKSAVVIVHYFELAADSSNTTLTTGSKSLSKSIHKLNIRIVHRR
jgi:hypothetical protein